MTSVRAQCAHMRLSKSGVVGVVAVVLIRLKRKAIPFVGWRRPISAWPLIGRRRRRRRRLIENKALGRRRRRA